MSLILDALSRAEREKRAGEDATPDLLAQPQHRSPEPSGPRVLLAVASMVLLLVLGVLVFRKLETSAPAPAPAPAPATATAPASARADTRAGPALPADTAPQTRASEAPVSPGAAVNPGPPAAPQSTAAAVPAGARQAPAPAPPSAEVAALYAAAGRAPAPAGEQSGAAITAPAAPGAGASGAGRVEEVIDLEALLREVQAGVEDDALAPHPTPLLSQLSKQFRDRVPTLMYLRHDFSADGRSSVLINGQALRVGQRSRGVELREILPDSIILRFDGTDFRLRALNSWVNL